MSNRPLEAIEDAVASALTALVAGGELLQVEALTAPLAETLARRRFRAPACFVATLDRRFLQGSGTPTPVYDARLEIEVTVVAQQRRSLADRVKGAGGQPGVMDLIDRVHAILDANALGLGDDPALVPLQPLSDRVYHPAPGLAAGVMLFATRMTYRTAA